MCTLGSDCVRSPLPSLVTITDEPVSAIRKLAPVMPTSAARNFCAQDLARLARRSCEGSISCRSGGSLVCRRRKSASTWSWVRWMAGAMMWLGVSCADLDEVLAEIGLDHLDAVRLERVVEADLLGDHRLALGDDPRAGVPADLADDAARASSAVGAKCTSLPASRRLLLERLEVEVEVGQRVVLDVAARVAQRLELRQAGARGPAPRRQARAAPPTAPAAAAGRAAPPRAFSLKAGEVIVLIGRPRRSADRVSSPASTSATWRTAILRPWRESLPAMFIRQPRSPASSMSAPVAAMCCGLALDDGVGDVGILDGEGAAEAAAHIGVDELDQLQPLRPCAGASAAARARRARAAPSSCRGRSPAPRAWHRRRRHRARRRGRRPARAPWPRTSGSRAFQAGSPASSSG